MGGIDEDREYQDIFWNALIKRPEKGQFRAKQACLITPRKDGASLKKQQNEAGESDGIEDREHQEYVSNFPVQDVTGQLNLTTFTCNLIQA